MLRGSIDIVEGLNRAWQAYAAAQTAAAAAATLATAAQEASARAASQAAVAHAEDAVAANADAVANQNLAMALGGRGLSLLGGGIAMMGGALVGGTLAAGFVGYKMATVGPQADARAAQKRTEAMEAGIERQREAEEAGRRQQDQIEHIERERREGQAKLREGAFERGMTREEKLREMTVPNIEKMMSGWSASREEQGRRDPAELAIRAKVEQPVSAPQAAARMPVGLPVQPPVPGLPVKAAPAETSRPASCG